MRYIGIEEVEKIAIGAAFLGTGGGGDPTIGKYLAMQAIEKNGPVKLLSPDEIDDDDLIVPSASMGAPTIMVEKISGGEEAEVAFKSLESYMGKEITATMPIEAGGVNSLIPLALAATFDLPVVDADGMGRAFPELQMVTFYLNDISATPLSLTDEKGNVMTLEAMNGLWAEKIARSATSAMGGSVFMAIYPMTGKQLKESAILHSLTYEEKIGDIILNSKNPIEELVEISNGHILFTGKLVDVERRTDGGFVKGKAKFEGFDGHDNSDCVLEFQNEHLICLVDGEPRCLTPDLITVLDIETGMPITTEGLRYGMRVAILGMPADDKWRTARGIETVGPGYFGYEYDFVPVEELN